MEDMKKLVVTYLPIGGTILACVSLLFSFMGHGNEGMTSDYGHFGLWEICVKSVGFYGQETIETCSDWGKNTVLLTFYLNTFWSQFIEQKHVECEDMMPVLLFLLPF